MVIHNVHLGLHHYYTQVLTKMLLKIYFHRHHVEDRVGAINVIRIKSGEPGFLGFSVPGWLGGVICKPEGAA